ncbi:MAG: phosphate ABC transporter permease subunit PstC [Chlorobiota bacterium]|nr:MAG: phosphate ABC transporter permease subunit PstC [Chlorobiota bacterium]
MTDMKKENGTSFAVDSENSVFASNPKPLRFSSDIIFPAVVRGVGLLTFLMVFFFFVVMIYQGMRVFEFLTPSDLLFSHRGGERVFEWYPVSQDPRYSVVPLLFGTLLTAVPATLISTLFGVGAGIYISEFAPYSLRGVLNHLIDLFSSLPTVAVGFMFLTIVATFFSDLFNPASRLNAALSALGLSMIIIPQIAGLTGDALRAVPRETRLAAYSLGAGKWRTVKDVVLPAAVSGITASIILGFGRAIGDTMIVLMISGNADNLLLDPFSSVRTMTATIAAELGEVSSGTAHFHALFFIGLILFTMSIILNLAVRWLVRRFAGTKRWR